MAALAVITEDAAVITEDAPLICAIIPHFTVLPIEGAVDVPGNKFQILCLQIMRFILQQT